MRVKIDGTVTFVGKGKYKGQEYDYFIVMQENANYRGEPEQIKITGNGVKVGDKVSVECYIEPVSSKDGRAYIKIKKK